MNESDLQTVTQRSSSRGQGSWLRWFAGGGVAAVLVIAMSSGCRPKVESPANKTVDAAGRSNLAPISVRTTNATERSMPRYLRVTGQLQGIQDAQVAADTAGKVIEAPVERGSLVKQGDILVKVDGRTAEHLWHWRRRSWLLQKTRPNATRLW
jgi:multidrug efflux pump subunit AcrA (membrane-fusion protein)